MENCSRNKRRALIAAALLALAACKKADKQEARTNELPEANNAMTNYAGSLQTDVRLAQQAVNKMNRGIAKTEQAAHNPDTN